jgi:glutathione synthase/RimK-type ligase-like ATP-grasp enzyme
VTRHHSRVALATYAELPRLHPDEQPLIPALQAEGVSAEPVVWSDQGVDWRVYDSVILRSCWDYHLRPAEFRAWIARLEALGVRMWNPPDVVRWNMDKRYLAQLAAAGIPIAPTVWLKEGTTPDVVAIVRQKKWKRVVVKPMISASSHDTWTAAAPLDQPAVRRVHEMLERGGVMLQRLIPEVATNGELSILFLGGQFSHAMLKRAAPGEFRVQAQYGGSAQRVAVSLSIVRAARRIVEWIPSPLLYARVDGVEVDGRFVLMELEVVEPSLFLEAGDGLFERAARVIRGMALARTSARE